MKNITWQDKDFIIVKEKVKSNSTYKLILKLHKTGKAVHSFVGVLKEELSQAQQDLVNFSKKVSIPCQEDRGLMNDLMWYIRSFRKDY